jgi:hypothetical protein
MKRLNDRVDWRYRSQGEWMAIQENDVSASRHLSPDDVLSKVRELGLATPREAAAMIREDRDGR